MSVDLGELPEAHRNPQAERDIGLFPGASTSDAG